jgi:hypothetical protein
MSLYSAFHGAHLTGIVIILAGSLKSVKYMQVLCTTQHLYFLDTYNFHSKHLFLRSILSRVRPLQNASLKNEIKQMKLE